MRDAALWSRIEGYTFPPERPVGLFAKPSGKSGLQARLEDDERWADDYAAGAIEEYRRFVYLARISSEEVTPSEVIDRVWHEHIWDTRDYRDGFCATVLGGMLHHHPGTGPGDADRHARQYDATRALYEAEFGRPPPPDIWQHRSAAERARDRARTRLAFVLSPLVGAATVWVLWSAFGWVLAAGFWGLAAGAIASHVIAPKVPGPRYRSSDSDGGADCGD